MQPTQALFHLLLPLFSYRGNLLQEVCCAGKTTHWCNCLDLHYLKFIQHRINATAHTLDRLLMITLHDKAIKLCAYANNTSC